MSTILIAAIVLLFILSIICFFIKNGLRKFTLKQIILLSGRRLGNSKVGNLIIVSTFSDILLMSSAVTFIVCSDYTLLVKILGGIFILVAQKVIIMLLSRMTKYSNNN